MRRALLAVLIALAGAACGGDDQPDVVVPDTTGDPGSVLWSRAIGGADRAR